MPWWTLGFKKAEWSLWSVWVIFSALAGVATSAVILLMGLWGTFYLTAVSEKVFYYSVLGSMTGAIIGAGQWLVLRRVVKQAGEWILASALAAAVVLAVGETVGETVAPTPDSELPFLVPRHVDVVGTVLSPPEAELSSFVLGVVAGTVTGTAQWFFLRKRVPQASLWILASATGWALAKTVHPLLYSGITGLVLVLLLRWAVQSGDAAADA